MAGPRLLIARHQPGPADLLVAGLPGEGFAVQDTRNMAATWISVRNHPPEAVLLSPLSRDTASAEFQSLLELCSAQGGPALLVLTDDPEFLVGRIDAVDDFLPPEIDVARAARRVRFALARRRALSRLRGERELLLQQATTDFKTGLFNDRHFTERGAEELARARRQEQPLGVLMIDFDGFKAINDVHGHPFGDHALATFATALRSRLRSFDVAARMGGDEFAVLLPGTRLEDAIGIAERVRAAVSGLDLAQGGRRAALSVSIGVAAWLPQDNLPLQDVLADADAALLFAKQQGRGRIGVHEGHRNRVLGAAAGIAVGAVAPAPATASAPGAPAGAVPAGAAIASAAMGSAAISVPAITAATTTAATTTAATTTAATTAPATAARTPARRAKA